MSGEYKCIPSELWKEIAFLLPDSYLKPVCKEFHDLYDSNYELNKSYVCPICYQNIQNDICSGKCTFLGCGHWYCEKCIHTWWETCKRYECPYCQWTPQEDIKVLRHMDGLLVKLTQHRMLKELTVNNIIEIINTNRFKDLQYRLAVDYLLSNDLNCQHMIDLSIVSLISRGYIKHIEERLYQPVY